MRTTFVIDAYNRAQSDIQEIDQPHRIAVGTPVVTAAPYTTELGVLPAGSKGFVNYIRETTGEVGILMEGMEPALVHWDNMLIIMPYDTEDLVEVLEFKRIPYAGERRLSTYVGIAAAAVTSLFVTY
ncbi:hypothetical protein [Bradyrhizobium barranii]